MIEIHIEITENMLEYVPYMCSLVAGQHCHSPEKIGSSEWLSNVRKKD
jgi:hypothetical protein